jgi:prepilin-type N-terminal cleavage/methylation domain-containing protein
MRRSGFTLIELLVVILIIVALAGLLIPLIGYARNAAKAAKCESQMAGIKATLSRYVDINGSLPDKRLGGGTDTYATTFKTGNTYKTADQLTSSDWTAIAQTLLEQLQTIDRDNFRDLASLRDPFTGGASATNVFRYRPAKFYPLLSDARLFIDGDGQRPDGSTAPPNPDSYQLWSTGPDGKDQFGERVNGRKSDDITNWKQP